MNTDEEASAHVTLANRHEGPALEVEVYGSPNSLGMVTNPTAVVAEEPSDGEFFEVTRDNMHFLLWPGDRLPSELMIIYQANILDPLEQTFE